MTDGDPNDFSPSPSMRFRFNQEDVLNETTPFSREKYIFNQIQLRDVLYRNDLIRIPVART